jgi:hypothetical protein
MRALLSGGEERGGIGVEEKKEWMWTDKMIIG